ncbi:MAG: hypothetical protein VB852_07755 [Deltaproteobacteria bacterium]
MSTLGDYLAYLALRLAWAAGRIIGPVLLRRVLETLGRVASRVDWRRRDVVADNLRNAFPEWSELRIASTATRTYANWGRIAAEVINVDTVVDEAAISRIISGIWWRVLNDGLQATQNPLYRKFVNFGNIP